MILMTRTIILVVALAGAVGLALGWLASAPPKQVNAGHSHEVAKPAPVPVDDGRREFPLRPEDVAEDRETPAVAVDSDGRILVAWAAVSGGNERTIHLVRSGDDGKTFDQPSLFRKVPIYRYTSRGKDTAMAYSTHALPRLTAIGNTFQLGWVEAINGGPEVHYYVASSNDGGKTFSSPESVHGKDASRPGFTALTVSADGSLLASWLEGRNGRSQPFFAQRSPDSAGFDREELVYSGPDGNGICPCCDMAAGKLSDGSSVVAFRNTDSGHRDIWFARAPAGGPFGPAKPLSLDKWTYSGCPHDAPSLAVQGGRVSAAWMSAYTGRNRIYVANSSAADLTFTARELSPAGSGAQGHPRLAAAAAGPLYAVWDESLGAPPPPAVRAGHGAEHGHGHGLTGDGRAVMLAVGSSDRSGFGPAVAVSPRPGAFQLNPAIAIGRDGVVLIAWNEIDTSGKRVVVVRHQPEGGTKP
jgi:hypothetical protein